MTQPPYSADRSSSLSFPPRCCDLGFFFYSSPSLLMAWVFAFRSPPLPPSPCLLRLSFSSGRKLLHRFFPPMNFNGRYSPRLHFNSSPHSPVRDVPVTVSLLFFSRPIAPRTFFFPARPFGVEDFPILWALWPSRFLGRSLK